MTIAAAGMNLVWPIFEGSSCLIINESISRNYGIETSGYVCNKFEGVIAPIITYELTKETCAIIGGAVYRGAAIPWLDGVYLFGDFCGGKVWALAGDDQAGWEMLEIANLTRPISSFGTDAAGEVYVLTFGGPILRLVEAGSDYVPSVTIIPSETVVPAVTGRK